MSKPSDLFNIHFLHHNFVCLYLNISRMLREQAVTRIVNKLLDSAPLSLRKAQNELYMAIYVALKYHALL